ncbi:MAG: hypothetical protein JSS82_12825 [Bacteroidetes bacterium]|nr:hypothetical protein [Bacteroidota bacterium]
MKPLILLTCLLITLSLTMSSCLYSHGGGYPGSYTRRSYWKQHDHYTRSSYRPRDYYHYGHHYVQYR